MREIVIDMTSNRTAVYNDTIIRQGENLATQLAIKLSKDFLGYNYALLFQLNESTPVLSGSLTATDGVVGYIIGNPLTQASGRLKMELQAYDVDGSVVKSAVYILQVIPSLDNTGAVIMPVAYVPWYAQALAEADRAVLHAGYASTSSGEASAYSILAGQSADNALVSEQNAKTSENNAKTSELNADASEAEALSSKNITTQTMHDFLAILGTDVATLDANGKLNIGQLPAVAINNTFPIALESELTSLVAETGDVAILIEDNIVTDTFILVGADPRVVGNWTKLGIGYVAEAGHAANSDTAINATMINNKRIVAMSQAEYDLAVKDPDTIYVVNP